jgi:raffinose/stachyose/melibiose transport system permease protein
MHNSWRYRLSVLVFIVPALAFFSVFVAYPIVQTAYNSFFDWDGIGSRQFSGIANYATLFKDSTFSRASANGFIFAGVLIVYQIGFATLLTLVLSIRKIRGRKFFRTAYFIPVVLSITVGSQLWLQIYNYDNGLLNKLFEALGFGFRQSWLQDGKTSIYAIAFVNAWQYLGIHFVLIYTAMKSIPEHFYDAAAMDGASFMQTHGAVTLPLLAETFRFTLIIAITGGLKAFENMFIMSRGRPATYTITYHMYNSFNRSHQYGYASASATILVIQCIVLVVAINRLIARERIIY